MQAKLHRWAVADPGRRFDDLFNFVYDPATLIAAFGRVAGNRGAATPGVDGLTVADVEEQVGVPGFLDDLRAALKDGSFRPLPVRERKIPKPGGSGKVRRLGIAMVTSYCLSRSRVSECSGLAVVRPCCRICWDEHGKWCRQFRGGLSGGGAWCAGLRG